MTSKNSSDNWVPDEERIAFGMVSRTLPATTGQFNFKRTDPLKRWLDFLEQLDDSEVSAWVIEACNYDYHRLHHTVHVDSTEEFPVATARATSIQFGQLGGFITRSEPIAMPIVQAGQGLQVTTNSQGMTVVNLDVETLRRLING